MASRRGTTRIHTTETRRARRKSGWLRSRRQSLSLRPLEFIATNPSNRFLKGLAHAQAADRQAGSDKCGIARDSNSFLANAGGLYEFLERFRVECGCVRSMLQVKQRRRPYSRGSDDKTAADHREHPGSNMAARLGESIARFRRSVGIRVHSWIILSGTPGGRRAARRRGPGTAKLSL